MDEHRFVPVCIHKCRNCAYPCKAAQLLWLPKTVVFGERY